MIFLDHLSLKTCLLTLRLIRGEELSEEPKSVQVLDPIKNNFLSWLLRKVMRIWKIDLHEVDFFAGHLKTTEGENVFTASQKIMNKIAFDAAKKNIDSSKVLSELNEYWKNNTILLYLAKYNYSLDVHDKHNMVMKILIADALIMHHTEIKGHLILGLPKGFTVNLFNNISPKLILHAYLMKKFSDLNNRLFC